MENLEKELNKTNELKIAVEYTIEKANSFDKSKIDSYIDSYNMLKEIQDSLEVMDDSDLDNDIIQFKKQSGLFLVDLKEQLLNYLNKKFENIDNLDNYDIYKTTGTLLDIYIDDESSNVKNIDEVIDGFEYSINKDMQSIIDGFEKKGSLYYKDTQMLINLSLKAKEDNIKLDFSKIEEICKNQINTDNPILKDGAKFLIQFIDNYKEQIQENKIEDRTI